jgi:hypothetical protein
VQRVVRAGAGADRALYAADQCTDRGSCSAGLQSLWHARAVQAEELIRLRIEAVLATSSIGRLVESYYRPDGPFAGTTFDLPPLGAPEVRTASAGPHSLSVAKEGVARRNAQAHKTVSSAFFRRCLEACTYASVSRLNWRAVVG